jgi:membrane protein implicated in regulation of membrane protease activity
MFIAILLIASLVFVIGFILWYWVIRPADDVDGEPMVPFFPLVGLGAVGTAAAEASIILNTLNTRFDESIEEPIEEPIEAVDEELVEEPIEVVEPVEEPVEQDSVDTVSEPFESDKSSDED